MRAHWSCFGWDEDHARYVTEMCCACHVELRLVTAFQVARLGWSSAALLNVSGNWDGYGLRCESLFWMISALHLALAGG